MQRSGIEAGSARAKASGAEDFEGLEAVEPGALQGLGLHGWDSGTV